jgi:hypothetical protein
MPNRRPFDPQEAADWDRRIADREDQQQHGADDLLNGEAADRAHAHRMGL